MKLVWIHRDIDAPAETLWQLLTDPDEWAAWGPTVRSARLENERMSMGAIGTVTTIVGFRVGFEITAFDEGTRWAWKVAGIPATDHTLEPLGPERCRVGFGVPWVAAPYLAACRIAMDQLDRLASEAARPST